jgi:hypothetical protein
MEWAGAAVTGALNAWSQASVAAAHASVIWSQATPDCRSATLLATNICLGVTPLSVVTPGLGPLSLGWGWALIGFIIGILTGLHFWDLVARLEPLFVFVFRLSRGPSLLAAQRPPWHVAVQSALLQTSDVHRRIVLQRLLDDGNAALDLLAAHAGVSRRAALSRLLGEQSLLAEWRL